MRVLLLKIPESAVVRLPDNRHSHLLHDYQFVDRLTQGFLRRSARLNFMPPDQLIWMRSLAQPFDQLLLYCGQDWPVKESLKWIEALPAAEIFVSGAFADAELKSLEKKKSIQRIDLTRFDLNQEPLCEL